VKSDALCDLLPDGRLVCGSMFLAKDFDNFEFFLTSLSFIKKFRLPDIFERDCGSNTGHLNIAYEF